MLGANELGSNIASGGGLLRIGRDVDLRLEQRAVVGSLVDRLLVEHRGRETLAIAVLLNDTLGVGAEAVLVVLVGHLDGRVTVDRRREVGPVGRLLAPLALELLDGTLGRLDSGEDDALPALYDDGGIQAPLAILLHLAQDGGPVDDTGGEEVLVGKPDKYHDVLVDLAHGDIAEARILDFLVGFVNQVAVAGLLLSGGIRLRLGALVGALVGAGTGIFSDRSDPVLDLIGTLLELGCILLLRRCEEMLVHGIHQIMRGWATEGISKHYLMRIRVW